MNPFVMKPSAARTLLALTLLVGAGVAPLSGFAGSCASRVQAAQFGQCGGCCSTSTVSCCGQPTIDRDCVCSHPSSPPVDPTQRDRSTQRVELRCVAIGTDVSLAISDGNTTLRRFEVVSSSSPTTRLQAVLCRWLI
ncbi:MAG TPA: hypothetical protein VMM76_19075 [Pirellulaceae bacterium]|nr:hypothetical protein [Pirellulaceae bacterium]